MRKSYVLSLVYFAAVVVLFIGERLIGAGSWRVISLVGGLALIASLALRVVRFRRASGSAKQVEKILLILVASGLGAIALYLIASDVTTPLWGKPFEQRWPKGAVAVSVLWPALFVISAIAIPWVELAYAAVARAPSLELGRILEALYAGLGLGCALVFAFAVTYVASERDKKLDLSHFRTARPGESTRKIVRTLDKPVEISLFFPPANEVRQEVRDYFVDLGAESKLLNVSFYDQAVDLFKARDLGVSGNGVVAVNRGGKKEIFSVGVDLEAARPQLRNLDREIQKRLLIVSRPDRIVYMTTGHEERSVLPAGDSDKRPTIRDLKELLTQQNYQVRDLGAAEGLAADVPKDASIVLIIGPQKPFLPEEVAALGRYWARGGRTLLALDPEAGLDGKELLAGFGLSFTPQLLANDQVYARGNHQDADRANIATASYSSHPSVTTLGRLGMRAPLVLFGSGWFEETKPKPVGVTVDFTVHAHNATWNDLNRNFQYDSPAEARKPWELGAAVVKKNGDSPTGNADNDARLIVLSDSDALGDGLVRNPGNALFVLDGAKWLLGEEAIMGEITSEVDVPVAHTRKQDLFWFYSTIFLAPAITLGIGRLATRRRRRSKNVQKEAA